MSEQAAAVRARGATVHALGAIALWSTLAWLGLSLAHVPPFLLVGVALCVGALCSVHRVRDWRASARVLALGIYGLFGFHFLLFLALRNAPPVEANLVNYLWPLLMVLLAPALLPAVRLHARHVVAGLMGFAGAALLIVGPTLGKGADATADTGAHPALGYACALGSALVWATYSLATKRVGAFPTATVGLFCAASGVLALACHVLFEPPASLALRDVPYLLALGLGPMGAAFFLWDAALKAGDPRRIGALAYLTPMLSTLLLAATSGRGLDWRALVAMGLIVGGAALAAGSARRRE
jgi:drug/metabolite transporter (DMT)-like permease